MASDRPFTTSEAAAELGVSRSTIKNWIKEFSLGAMRDTRGDWRIDPEALPVFEEVKRLRDEGLGLESIRRVIGAPAPVAGVAVREPVARPGLVTRFPAGAPTPYDEPSQACDVVTDDVTRQTLGAAIESQERLAMQMARLAHANGQLQAQLKYVGAELPRLQQQVEQLEARNGELELNKEGGELEQAMMAQRLAAREAQVTELETELVSLQVRVAELEKQLAARPKSGMNFPFAGGDDAANNQLMELQRELIKAKECIAAFEAAEYARTDEKRPWWNFWD